MRQMGIQPKPDWFLTQSRGKPQGHRQDRKKPPTWPGDNSLESKLRSCRMGAVPPVPSSKQTPLASFWAPSPHPQETAEWEGEAFYFPSFSSVLATHDQSMGLGAEPSR